MRNNTLKFWCYACGLVVLWHFCQAFQSYGESFENWQTVFTRRDSEHSTSYGSVNDEKPLPPSPVEKGHESPNKWKPIIAETTLGNDTHLTAVITWTHYDSKVIFIITCDHVKKIRMRSFCTGNSNVYRSTNYGKSFDLESHKFDNNSKISIINTSPRNRKIIFAQDQINRQLYVSFDEGNSYSQSHLSFSPIYLSFHPQLSQFIVLVDSKKNIYLSNDTGISWKPVLSNVRNFFWLIQKQINTSQIFFEVISLKNTKLPTKNYSLVFVAEEPYYHTAKIFDHNLGLIFPNSLYVNDDFTFIQRKTSAGNRRLFVLYKTSQKFEECELPTNDMHIDFHFVEGRENQIMLAALTKQGFTNLYSADKIGKKFSLILENVEALWKHDSTIIDVHRVEGVPGTLIANQVGTGTVISYNNGGIWSNLQPPDHNDNGKIIKCYHPQCIFKLSLYIQDKFVIGWSPITSSKYAPGVIIAQGTLIMNSEDPKKYLSGFLSSDGGQSWKQTLKGRHIYQLLDHGGMFAGIPITNPFLGQTTNEIHYSCNEGMVWDSVLLKNQVSRIVGVAAHPATKASILKIFGADFSQTRKFVWTIWQVNFTSVFTNQCSKDNYTMWTAGAKQGDLDSCILGQKYVYEKKKDNVCCSYGINFHRKKNITVCQCTMNDFECDFGFKRDSHGGLCIPTSFASLGPPVNCPEGGEYVKSKGYIKIKGDLCQGGIENELMPTTKKCPAQAPDGISLSVQKYSIALGKTAEIVLHQQSGFLETKYNWDYGDGVQEYNLTSDERTRYHKYKNVGTYVISVLASNSAGSFSAKTVMRVIERVSEVVLHVTKPVVAMEGATYTAELITHGTEIADRHGFVHFAWIFEPIKTPVLSLNSSVQHTYDKPGTYEVEVRVFNAISVVSTTTSVTVFGDVRVMEMQFSSTLDLLNKGTKAWNELFKSMICEYLIKTFKVRREMIVVDVSKTLPTIVTLSLVQNTVPVDDSKESNLKVTAKPQFFAQSIDTVMQQIILRVRSRKISFFMFGQEVRVLQIKVLRGKKKGPVITPAPAGLSAAAKRDFYIGGSVGGIFALLCLTACIMYCRKRKRCRKEDKYLVMQDEITVQGDFSMDDMDTT